MAITTTSKQFLVNARDFIRALGYAMISPVFPIVIQSIKANSWVFDWTAIWHTAVGAGVAYLATKFFTPSQTISTPAKILLFLVLFGLAKPGQAQILQPFPKPDSTVGAAQNWIDSLPIPTKDSTVKAWRWTGLSALYGYQFTTSSGASKKLFVGSGISYEHGTYRAATKRWNIDWGIGGGLYWGQDIDNSKNSCPAAAIYTTLLNKHLIIGIFYSFADKQLLGAGGPNGFFVPTN